MTFVICSSGTRKHGTEAALADGKDDMTGYSTRTFLIAAALTGLATSALTTSALTTSALAQAAAPTPWELKPDMGYGYDKDGKTFSYQMGTNNAGTLLKGAKKVPKGTLFFLGHNGQLYMRTGPYLEGDGKFMFGTN
jgi:hypothetical protein